MQSVLDLGYSIFDSALYRNGAAKRLFLKKNPIARTLSRSTCEAKMLSLRIHAQRGSRGEKLCWSAAGARLARAFPRLFAVETEEEVDRMPDVTASLRHRAVLAQHHCSQVPCADE